MARTAPAPKKNVGFENKKRISKNQNIKKQKSRITSSPKSQVLDTKKKQDNVKNIKFKYLEADKVIFIFMFPYLNIFV
jgi:hypothetical protein